MCLVLLSFKVQEDFPLIIASNRDEFYERPTSIAKYWDDHSHILAGRDKKYGGTWLGMNKKKRIGILTNFRAPKTTKGKFRSRGLLINKFLSSDISIDGMCNYLISNKDSYKGYNLFFGYVDNLYYYSNKTNFIRKLNIGTYGLSNHLLDTPWPKVKRIKKLFHDSIDIHGLKEKKILELLRDKKIANDNELPETGIGQEYERVLSSIFIRSPLYGTRSSTVITMDRKSNISLLESTYDHNNDSFSNVRYSI